MSHRYWNALALHRQLDDVPSRAVVVSAALDHGKEDDKSRPRQRPQVLVWDILLIQAPRLVHERAEGDGHQRRQDGQRPAAQHGDEPQIRQAGQAVRLPGQAQQPGDGVGRQGGQQAGEQGGVAEMAHVHHLQGKHGGGEGGAEQGGEQPRHAALDDGVHIPVPQAQQPPDPGGDAAADLKGRPLPPGAAAGEVGEHRPQEDQRRQPHRGTLPAPDAGDDLVGAAVVFHPGGPVAPDDGQPRQGHRKQQPGVGGAQGRRLGHAPGERRPRQPAGRPRQPRQPQPLDQGPEGGQGVQELLPQLFHHAGLSPSAPFFLSAPLYQPCQGLRARASAKSMVKSSSTKNRS